MTASVIQLSPDIVLRRVNSSWIKCGAPSLQPTHEEARLTRQPHTHAHHLSCLVGHMYLDDIQVPEVTEQLSGEQDYESQSDCHIEYMC